MATFTQRMIGAARLNAATYEEIEADTTATGQAMSVVILAAVAAGIGSLGDAGLRGLIATTLAALAGWFIWAGLTWLIGTKLLPESQTQADFGQLLRTIGFSSVPGLLRVLGFIPILGGLIVFVSSVWMLAAMVVAVRQALDYRGTGRAVIVCAIGFVAYMAVTIGLVMILGLGKAITNSAF